MRIAHSLLLGFAAAAAPSMLCTRPSAQESFVECTRVLHTTLRPLADGYERSLAIVPDVNGDGVGELLLGSARRVYVHEPGRVELVDGRTGASLLRVDGVVDDRLGRALGPAGDFDGDGLGDLLVGAPGVGAARVYSSVSGALLREVTGPAGSFGQTVVGLGDLDLDAVPDFAVGEFDRDSVTVQAPGRVSIVSGADGHELRSLPGSGDEHFGLELVRVPDVTLDGRAELAVLSFARVSVIDVANGVELFTRTPGSGDGFAGLVFLPNVGGHPRVDRPGLAIVGQRDDLLGPQPIDIADRGLIQIVTADTGLLVREYTGHFGEFYGRAAGLGDVDGDRFSDLLVSGFGPAPAEGWLAVLSGRTGGLLRQVNLAGGFVDEVAALPDADGDGRAEYVATSDFWNGTDVENRVLVVAGSAPVVAFGSAFVGSGGVEPQISLGGCPRVRGTLRIETERVLGGAPGVLVVGAARADLPFHGGTLYPRQDFRFAHRAGGARGVPGAGDAALALGLPSDPALAGLEFFAQAVYLDRGALQGFALTRALELTLY